jgi:cell wall-associated NlpC family hydrolase
MLSEEEARPKIVAEALSWVGVPYRSNAMVKDKVGGGTDCAMLLAAVYGPLGLIPGWVDPRPYSPQWHIHRNEEEYMGVVLAHAHEIAGPPRPGDVAMFKIGKVFAHGAIVIDWPNVVHAVGGSMVLLEDVSKNRIGKRALWLVPRKYFSLWRP